jgi:hypothetical protein
VPAVESVVEVVAAVEVVEIEASARFISAYL